MKLPLFVAIEKLNAGDFMPIAINVSGLGRLMPFPSNGGTELIKPLKCAMALWADAYRIDQAIHGGHIIDQILPTTGLGLNTIKHKKTGGFLALYHATVRVVDATSTPTPVIGPDCGLAAFR